MRASLALLVMLGACGAAPPSPNAARDVAKVLRADAPKANVAALNLKANDGVTVYGTLYRAAKPRAVILLFHQAGSGRGEYVSIAPRLVAAGYTALAIDQRAGGTLYGKNETAAALGKEAGYLDARPDLQAALDWAETQKLPVILWGSSYSSALIFPLAANNPGKVRALLSFSPGEYFDGALAIGPAAGKVTVPVFVTTAGTPAEIATAQSIVAAIPPGKAIVYVPKAGVHGSSTLIATKNPAGAEANWRAVFAFLKAVAP
jgi:dienelactone hydrolase